MSRYIGVEGRKLVVGRRELRLRGVNIGNWMNIEGFMIGLPYVEHKIREAFAAALGEKVARRFFDSYVDSYVTEADVRFLARQGFNLVRVPFNFHHFESHMRPYRYLERGFRCLDRIVRWCRKHGVYVLLDFHAAPGSQSEDWHADNATSEPMFFEVADFQRRALELWAAIARRYRAEPCLLGYDLLNEPNTEHVDRLNGFYAKTIAAIRTVDRNHVIVVEGTRWSDDIFSLDRRLFRDPNTMASFHHYPFMWLKKYPGRQDGQYYDREALLKTMENKLQFYRKVKRPLLLGECGFSTWRRTSASRDVLADLLAAMEERGIHWCLWSYKDVGAMGLVVPKKGTPWMRFVRRKRVGKARSHSYHFRHELRREFDRRYQDVPADLRSRSSKQIWRAFERLSLYEVARDLARRDPTAIAAMPRSFLFENCTINRLGLRMLKRFLLTRG